MDAQRDLCKFSVYFCQYLSYKYMNLHVIAFVSKISEEHFKQVKGYSNISFALQCWNEFAFYAEQNAIFKSYYDNPTAIGLSDITECNPNHTIRFVK